MTGRWRSHARRSRHHSPADDRRRRTRAAAASDDRDPARPRRSRRIRRRHGCGGLSRSLPGAPSLFRASSSGRRAASGRAHARTAALWHNNSMLSWSTQLGVLVLVGMHFPGPRGDLLQGDHARVGDALYALWHFAKQKRRSSASRSVPSGRGNRRLPQATPRRQVWLEVSRATLGLRFRPNTRVSLAQTLGL